MTLVRLAVVVAVLGLGAHWWNQRSETAALARVTDSYAFVPVPMPSGSEPDAVLSSSPRRTAPRKAHSGPRRFLRDSPKRAFPM